MQSILNGITSIETILKNNNSKRCLLVCGSSFKRLPFSSFMMNLGFDFVVFDAFTPNPSYEEVCAGVKLFQQTNCDTVVAVGGGSALDVAKCIKLFSSFDDNCNYLGQPYTDNNVLLIAVPTTAGTGSESTRYAVIYVNGEKHSVTSDFIIPSFAILEPSVLKTLPIYQKKCTFLDALCQGIESYWSVNSTTESKEYAKLAILGLMKNYREYLFEDKDVYDEIMLASNYSGRAINISQTTAAHAMSYKLTSLYTLPHGYAVAICLPEIWSFMIENVDYCNDKRGKDYLTKCFTDIANLMGKSRAKDAIEFFKKMLEELEIVAPNSILESDISKLAKSVNLTRLKNNPVTLSENALHEIYRKILIDN